MGIARNISITFISRILSFILSFSVSIFIARILGPELRGVYALTILIPTLMVKLGTLGIEASNIYFTGSNKYVTKKIVSNSLIAAISIGTIIIILFYFLLKFNLLNSFIHSNKIDIELLWIAVLTVPFSLIFLYLSSVLLGKEEIINYNILNILRLIVQFLFVLFFLVILRMSLRGAVLSYVLTVIVIVIVSIIFVSKLTIIKIIFDKGLFKDTIKYGFKAYFGNIAQFLNYRLDIFFVASYLTPLEVGYYSIAVSTAEKIWMLPGAISTVLFPRISTLKGNTEANNLTLKITRNTLFIVTLFSIILAIFAKPLVKLFYGISYLPSVKPLIVLLPGIIALSGSKTLTADLAGRGKPQFGAYSSFASLLVNIPLNILLIPRWGISGAAFASSVAYIVATSIVMIVFVKITNNSFFDIIFIKFSDFRNVNYFRDK